MTFNISEWVKVHHAEVFQQNQHKLSPISISSSVITHYIPSVTLSNEAKLDSTAELCALLILPLFKSQAREEVCLRTV